MHAIEIDEKDGAPVPDERLEIDLATGEKVRVPFTPEEQTTLAQRQNDAAAADVARQVEHTARRADVVLVKDETKTMQERFRALLRLLRDRLDE